VALFDDLLDEATQTDAALDADADGEPVRAS
jgi:hypothetical protein